MDEQSLCANIQRLTEQLNSALEAAYGMGLKVKVTAEGAGIFVPPVYALIGVRVWREIESVNVSPEREFRKIVGNSLREMNKEHKERKT
jgi:hypothetical protein